MKEKKQEKPRVESAERSAVKTKRYGKSKTNPMGTSMAMGTAFDVAKNEPMQTQKKRRGAVNSVKTNVEHGAKTNAADKKESKKTIKNSAQSKQRAEKQEKGTAKQVTPKKQPTPKKAANERRAATNKTPSAREKAKKNAAAELETMSWEDFLSAAQGNPVSSKNAVEKPQNKGTKDKKATQNKKKAVKIIFLGGVGEIGKNMTAIEYGDDIIIVDAGLTFPNTEDMPGIDSVVPDITYLAQNKDKVRGVLLTHGHEDHIGGVPYLMKELAAETPIYATKLTLMLTDNKLQEHHISNVA